MNRDELEIVAKLVESVNRILNLWDSDNIGSNPKLIFAGYEAIHQIQTMRNWNALVENLCRNVRDHQSL